MVPSLAVPDRRRSGPASRQAGDLLALRNLGPRSAAMLREAGFASIAALREAGAVAAFQRLRFLHGRGVSRNLLWALAAGLEDRDWRSLSDAEKTTLLALLPPSPPRPRR
jgi:hypothetical protein